jgi:hypothetical protein
MWFSGKKSKENEMDDAIKWEKGRGGMEKIKGQKKFCDSPYYERKIHFHYHYL